MSETRTGKYIYELEELTGNLKNEAWFALSQDNITRKMSARVLRQFINGDNDQPSEESYYSSKKITALFNNTGDLINQINTDIANINKRIDDLTNTVNSNYHTLDSRITKEVRDLNARIDREVKTLNDRITTEVNRLDGRIDKEITDRTAADTELRNDYNTKITNLNTKLESWILYGSSVPSVSSCPAGRLYIQYF